MLKRLRSFVTIHICAVCWVLTLVFALSGVYLAFSGSIVPLVGLVSGLYISTKLKIPYIGFIGKFLVEGAKHAVGGCEIVHSITAPRSRESHTPRLYAIHPHGLTSTCAGLALSHCNDQGDRVSLAVAPFLQWCNPAMKILMNCVGVDLISCSSEHIRSTMKARKSVGIVIGGFDEMLRNRDDADIVYLQNRKGFMKYAIQHGYDIIPVYCFGESMLYSNVLSLPERIRDFLADWKIPMLLPRGRAWWNAMPRSLHKGVRIVFGDPIRLPKETNPSKDLIDKVHNMYIDVITNLYSRYNPYPDRPLVIM